VFEFLSYSMKELPPSGMPETTTASPTGEPHPDAAKRPIRSFVIRHGRLSTAQSLARDEGSPRFGVPFAPQIIDFPSVFGRTAPTILEIGFGMGETTAAIARAYPDTNYVGIEVHRPGIGALFKRIEAEQLTNLRIIEHDAIEVLDRMIAPHSLAGVHLYFPDPWPKKRHHKRRIINVGLLDRVARALAPGAYFHMATDWEEYAIEALGILAADGRFINTADGFAPRPQWRPTTKFEQRGLRLGHGVWDLLFRTATAARR
jgi:tRNA (guanine-N7-)-methyltransferase